MGGLGQGITRRKRASSAVGIPDLDTSGADILNAIAKTTADVSQVLKAREEKVNNLKAIEKAQEIEAEVESLVTTIKGRMETGELTTEQGVNLMKAARKDTSKKLLGDIKNKDLRFKTTLRNQFAIGNGNAADVEWIKGFQQDSATLSAQKISDQIAVQAGNLRDIPTLVSLMHEQEGVAGKVMPNGVVAHKDGFLTALGGTVTSESLNALKEATPKNMLLSYINQNMINAPEQLEKDFNKFRGEVFGKLLNSTEMKTQEDRIVAAANGLNRTTQLKIRGKIIEQIGKPNQSIEDLQKFQLDMQRQADNPRNKMPIPKPLAVAVDNMIKERLARTAAFKAARLDNDTLLGLVTRHENLKVNTKPDGSLKDGVDTLDEIVTYLVDVENRLAENKIDDASARQLKKEVVVAAQNFISDTGRAKGVGSWIRGLYTDLDNKVGRGIRKIDNRLDTVKGLSSAQKKDLRGKLMLDLMIVNDRADDDKLIPKDENDAAKEKRLDDAVDKVFKTGATKHGFPELSENNKMSYLDPETGRRYAFENNEYTMIA